jgi:hypothetical protein
VVAGVPPKPQFHAEYISVYLTRGGQGVVRVERVIRRGVVSLPSVRVGGELHFRCHGVVYRVLAVQEVCRADVRVLARRVVTCPVRQPDGTWVVEEIGCGGPVSIALPATQFELSPILSVWYRMWDVAGLLPASVTWGEECVCSS